MEKLGLCVTEAVRDIYISLVSLLLQSCDIIYLWIEIVCWKVKISNLLFNFLRVVLAAFSIPSPLQPQVLTILIYQCESGSCPTLSVFCLCFCPLRKNLFLKWSILIGGKIFGYSLRIRDKLLFNMELLFCPSQHLCKSACDQKIRVFKPKHLEYLGR